MGQIYILLYIYIYIYIYMYVYIYIIDLKKKTKQQPRNLLYSTRNYIQYLIITYSGKESKTECVCVCVCVYTYINQYARYLKDCKITMLQFRNFFKKEKDTGRLPNSCRVNSSMDYLLFGLFPAPFKFQGDFPQLLSILLSHLPTFNW